MNNTPLKESAMHAGKQKYLWILPTLLLIGCAGRFDYFPPLAQGTSKNTITINKSKEVVWQQMIPSLGKQFFVINNMDKSSGFLNVSYSGAPEKYVDCGMMTSYVKNARGERTYNFPASSGYQEYEVMTGGNLLFVRRKMTLEGRINIIFEDLGGEKTRVTANTKYIVTRNADVQQVAGGAGTRNDTISFQSGQSESFPVQAGNAVRCVPTGKLEQEVLSLAE